MNKYALLAAAAAITAMATPALAQTTTGQSQTERIGSIFGALFGDRLGTTPRSKPSGPPGGPLWQCSAISSTPAWMPKSEPAT